MQCNCITETTQRITEHVKAQLGDTAKADCKSTVITFGESLDAMFAIHFEITADKPGYRKGKVMNMVVSYCPFCGKPAKPPKAEAPAAQPAP